MPSDTNPASEQHGRLTPADVSFWNHAYSGDHAQHTTIQNVYTLASPLYWYYYGNKCFGNDRRGNGWLDWLRRTCEPLQPSRILELGSGNGSLCIDVFKMGFTGRIEGVDFSPVAVELGGRKAAELGATNVEFRVADLNTIELEPQSYDLIVAQMTIHHVEAIEHLFGQIRRALSPNGVFAINEYVGPNRWQFTTLQVLMANLLLKVIPERLKLHHPNGSTKAPIRRPTVEEMLELDPTESIRSEEILPLFGRYFEIEHRIDYGGAVSIPVLENIIGNFSEDDPVSIRWLRRVLRVDHLARKLHLVPSVNVVLMGRRSLEY